MAGLRRLLHRPPFRHSRVDGWLRPDAALEASAPHALDVSKGGLRPVVSPLIPHPGLYRVGRDARPGALAMSHRCVTAAVVARLPYLPHVLDRPAGEKRGQRRLDADRGPPAQSLMAGAGGRQADGTTLPRRLARRRGRARRGRTPRGGRRGRRSSRRSSSTTNASRLSATSAGESIGRMNSHTAARSAPSPPGSASRSLRAIRSEPSALVRVTPAGSSTNAAPSRAVSWAMPRSGSGSASARSSSASMIASSWRGSWRPVSPTGCWRSGSVQPAP